jgi:hypothetical protein
MENASKALLIAGAILIVILLIAVGMMVYRGAQGSIQKAIGSMSSTEKDIHNSQFEPFVGTKVSGSNVRSLLSKMITNNSDDNNVQVKLKGIGTDPNAVMGQITTAASATYKVEATYSEGVITEINVSKNS